MTPPRPAHLRLVDGDAVSPEILARGRLPRVALTVFFLFWLTVLAAVTLFMQAHPPRQVGPGDVERLQREMKPAVPASRGN